MHVDNNEDSSDVDREHHDHGDNGGEGDNHLKFKIELILYHDGTFLYCW